MMNNCNQILLRSLSIFLRKQLIALSFKVPLYGKVHKSNQFESE